MKLGIIGKATENDFKMAKAKKLEFIELCINVEQKVSDLVSQIESIRGWMNQYEVSIGSIGRWGSLRINSEGIVDEEFQNDIQLIDTAHELGCGIYVCGCNEVKELSYYDNCRLAISYFTKLMLYGQTKGVRIAVYNCGWNNFVDNPQAWRIIHGHLKDLGIKYDPSHSRYAGREYLQEMKEWGNRFYHVHIKGSLLVDGERIDDPPAGLDQTDWGSFMAILYAQNYKGGLSIEPHSDTWIGDLGDKGIDYTVRMMNGFLLKD